MTEQEAKVNNSGNSPYIKNSQNTETETCEKCLYIKSQCKCNKSEINASCIGINEAQEYLLNRYLVVGSPVNPPKEECEMHNAVLDIAIKALEEIQQYRALGTVEELRVARDKQVEEICEWEYDELEEQWQTDCGVLFTIHDSDREITNYCPCCGKRIKVRCEDDNH